MDFDWVEIESLFQRESFSERAVLIRLEFGIHLSVFEVQIGFYFIYNIKIYTRVGLEMEFCEMGLCQFFLWFWYIHRVKMIWRSFEHEFLGRDSLYCNLLVNDSMCHSSNTLIWFDYWPSRPYTSHCAKTFFSCWKPARVCVNVGAWWERKGERACVYPFVSFFYLFNCSYVPWCCKFSLLHIEWLHIWQTSTIFHNFCLYV